MATYEQRSSAQDVISCNVCKNPTQQFCNSCQVNLCVKCVPKHVDDKQSMSHDIVHFRNRKVQLVFTECEFHEGQRCEAQCQQCNIPICIKCCIGPHKNHDAVDIAELVERKKQEIQKDTDEIEEQILTDCKKTVAELPDKLKQITADITKTEQETEKLRKIWHQEVDDIFDKMASMFAASKNKHSETLTKQEIKMKTSIQSMNQTLQRNKAILTSNNASDFTDYKSELDSYRGININTYAFINSTKPILKVNTVRGKNMSIEVEKTKASLTLTSLDRQVCVPKLPTNYKRRSENFFQKIPPYLPSSVKVTYVSNSH